MRLSDPRGIWVKVDGVTRPEDVECCIEAGVSAVGFIFALSLRQITKSKAAKLRSSIGDRALAFGVFDENQAVAKTAAKLALDGIQVPQATDLAELPGRLVVLRTIRVRDASDLADTSELDCDAVHVDAYVEGMLGGTGHLAPWEEIARAVPNRPWVLSGGLNPDNVHQAIATLSPDGVDVSSGVESSPGIKDADKVRAFVEAARS